VWHLSLALKDPFYNLKITYLPNTPSLPFVDNLLLPVGLNPYTPQKAAGILTEPAESEQTPKTDAPEATCAPYPPDEPPEMNYFL